MAVCPPLIRTDTYSFTRNHERLFEWALALPVVQKCHLIVVAKYKEIVVVTTIPACNLGGLGIPVGLSRVGLDIPFVPLGLRHEQDPTTFFATVGTVFTVARIVNR